MINAHLEDPFQERIPFKRTAFYFNYIPVMFHLYTPVKQSFYNIFFQSEVQELSTGI
jgi:hypothetical protein